MENEQYEMAVTHYFDTVDSEEREIASADAKRMEKENPKSWAVKFCEEYNIEIV